MKILIVDDSALVRSILKQILPLEMDFTVVGEATNGDMALKMNSKLSPDLIIMDINMPIMDGIEATGKIMKTRPVPILILSSHLDAAKGFEALNSGAVDVMSKPDLGNFNDPKFYKEFFKKLREIAAADVSRKKARASGLMPADSYAHDCTLLVMGASTGGPAAVRSILSKLPSDLALCIALVQHLEAGFDRGYAEWLNGATGLTVKLALQRNSIVRGEVIVSPVDYHLKVEGDELVIDNGLKVNNHRPSVDVLFDSAAVRFRENLIGVLLTGMGVDGAEGCHAIKTHGGLTIVQDEETSVIFGMPKSAIAKDAASIVLPLPDIAGYILTLLHYKKVI